MNTVFLSTFSSAHIIKVIIITPVVIFNSLSFAQTHSPNNSPSFQNSNKQPISTSNKKNYAAFSTAGRDPFAITPQMLDNENFSVKQPVEFVPLSGNVKLPKMSLRGVITDADNDKALTALLEIEGLGVFVVREGDTVGLSSIGNGQDVILIESINRLSLVVRTGSYGGVSDQRFVIR